MANIDKLEKSIGIEFKNRDLLLESLTHRSYLNENPKWSHPHNERLEFLGDAILELIITEDLFFKYPHEDEGVLTSYRSALVNYQILSKIAKKIEIGKFIYLSAGEAKDVGRAREVILANTFESLVGAIYLDQGYEITKRFIYKFVFVLIDEVVKAGSYKDPKSYLQEIIQDKLRVTPTYKVLEERGPDHKRIFHVGVFYGEKLIAEGEGLSKQEAEVVAAEKALRKEDA